MNDKPVFDPDRDRAFRAMIVENARAESARPSLRARASLLIGLVVAAVLVSVGGVAVALTGVWEPPAEVPVITATPTPTPVATATPTPTPEPLPSEEPEPTVADPAEWIIDFDGVGPIVLGGPMADATAALDSTDLVPYSQGVDGCLSDLRRVGDTSAGLAVDPDQSGTSVGLITVENYVTEDGEQSEAALPSTEAGITVGSTGTALRETYPDLGEWTTRSGETGYSLDDSSGHRLWFRVDSTTDLVESIALSDADRYPVGGCGA